jgi:hypothetical protein
LYLFSRASLSLRSFYLSLPHSWDYSCTPLLPSPYQLHFCF